MEIIVDDSNVNFWGNPKTHNFNSFYKVDYSFETNIPKEEAASFFCREHSTSTWKKLHGENKSVTNLRGAKVLKISDSKFQVAFPFENIGNDFSNYIISFIGNSTFFNKRIFNRLTLENITIPKEVFNSEILGPRYSDILYGISKNKVMLIGVQKPSIGISYKAHIRRVKGAFLGGCDIVKEDEQLRMNDPICQISKRIDLLDKEMPLLLKETRRKLIYLFNINKFDDQTIFLLEKLNNLNNKYQHRVFGVLLSISMGFSVISYIRQRFHGVLSIHPSGIGLFLRGPISFSMYSLVRILRIIGADIIIIPAPFNKISFCKEIDAESSIRSATQRIFSLKRSIISFGCGVSKEHIPKFYSAFGRKEYSLLVGGDIFGCNEGPLEGAKIFAKRLNEW